MAKDFKKNPAEFYTSEQPEETERVHAVYNNNQPEESERVHVKKSTASVPEMPEGFKPPLGYTLTKETKSKTITLQISPRVFNAINKLVAESGMSRNSYLNEVLWNYLMDKGVLEDEN